MAGLALLHLLLQRRVSSKETANAREPGSAPSGWGQFWGGSNQGLQTWTQKGQFFGFFLEQCTRFWAWSHPKMKVITLLPIAPDGDRDSYIVPIALSSSRAEAMQYFSQSAESETLLTSKIRLKTHPRRSSTKATCFLFLWVCRGARFCLSLTTSKTRIQEIRQHFVLQYLQTSKDAKTYWVLLWSTMRARWLSCGVSLCLQ